MPKVEIYTKMLCPYCTRAKALLNDLQTTFTEHKIFWSPKKFEEMVERSNGGRTVPQIFIDGQCVGGCDELHTLHREGKLAPLLGRSSAD